MSRPFSFRCVAFLLLAGLWPALASAQTPASTAADTVADLPVVASKVNCSALASPDLSQTVGTDLKLTAAVVQEAGSASYCKVNVVVDDYGKIEVHLPVATWNQRFLAGGGPGLSPQAAGFVTMGSQDLGNRGNEDVFATNYELRVDAAYRIMHLQVLTAKALIAKYYSQGPKYSYYNACSEPGREGMMEVQRFPNDFDGAVTGCPPINDVINNGIFYAWNILTNTGPDGQYIITADKLPILHKAVLEECDALDGAKDSIVSDPLACHPKLTEVQCKPGDDPSTCLTPEQIHVALELYRGAHDANGGKLVPVGVLPGSELQWTRVIAAPPPPPGRNAIFSDRDGTTYALRSEFSDPPLGTKWQLSDMRFDRASFDHFTKMRYLFDATDPDLSAFAKAGHKLIIWQGLADTNVLPAHSILYYTALQRTLGAKVVDQFVRLYLLPGVGHCGGGDGPSIRDFLAPLQAWVERGIPPGALLATHVPQSPRSAQGVPGGPPPAGSVAAQPDLTRLVYPYPYTQKYTGSGSVREAANFVEGPARPAPSSLFNWWGRDFYRHGYMKWCTATGPSTLHCVDK